MEKISDFKNIHFIEKNLNKQKIFLIARNDHKYINTINFKKDNNREKEI